MALPASAHPEQLRKVKGLRANTGASLSVVVAALACLV